MLQIRGEGHLLRLTIGLYMNLTYVICFQPCETCTTLADRRQEVFLLSIFCPSFPFHTPAHVYAPLAILVIQAAAPASAGDKGLTLASKTTRLGKTVVYLKGMSTSGVGALRG